MRPQHGLLVDRVAFLRAVNVAGYGVVSMAKLRELFAKLGVRDAQTVLASGNVVFKGDRRTPAQLERVLEAETAKHLGLSTDYVVRTKGELEKIIEANPLRAQARTDPGHLLVVFLKDTPAAGDVKALQAAVKGPEIVKPGGRQLYIYYAAGVGRSKLTPAIIDRVLGTRGTARNWNTIMRLLALMR